VGVGKQIKAAGNPAAFYLFYSPLKNNRRSTDRQLGRIKILRKNQEVCIAYQVKRNSLKILARLEGI
jgi:hypothetical protein